MIVALNFKPMPRVMRFVGTWVDRRISIKRSSAMCIVTRSIGDLHLVASSPWQAFFSGSNEDTTVTALRHTPLNLQNEVLVLFLAAKPIATRFSCRMNDAIFD